MEDRERKWIKKNLPDLIQNTNCNVLLLSYLQSKDIISSSDVEDISAGAGDLAKAKKLYQILSKRAGSFDILQEALEHVRQTGALAILQKLAGPKWVLDPQRMFLSAGENVVSFLENKKRNILVISSISTKITTDKILQNVPMSILLSSSDVLMQNFELKPWIKTVLVDLDEKWSQVSKTLGNYKHLKLIFIACTNSKLLETIQTKYKGTMFHQKDNTCWADLTPSFQFEIANRVNQKCFGFDVSKILEQLEENILLELIFNNAFNLFTSGIESVTSYYVDRIILYKNAISPSIFENQSPDIWVFKNMKKEELASLAKGFQFDFTSRQIHEPNITCQFLILDYNTDFESICSKTKSTVHLIEQVDTNLYWTETRGNLGIVLNSIEEKVCKEFSEAELIEAVERKKGVSRNTVIISDTPGMGKSLLLENLGRRLMEKYPDRMVIFVSWSEFVDKFSVGSKVQFEDILQVLVKVVSNSKLSESIFQQIFRRIQIELLLDGFDEIKPEKIEIALDILSEITKCMPKFRKWVTARPHYQQQLEEHCCNIAYHIAPFNEQNQTQFLNSFWIQSFATSQAYRPNVLGNEIQSLNSNLLSKFAKCTLREIKNCLNQLDTDIVGIPLQCMLIAEALQDDAFRCSKSNNCNNLNALEFSFPVSSISELYRLFVATKIKYYFMRTENSKLDLQTLELVHYYYSLLLLFPQQVTKFNFQDKLDSINSVDYLAVGILQARSLHDSPRFIHRTFAEYFISEFCIQQMQEPTISDYFLEFLFETVLNTDSTAVLTAYLYLQNTYCFREKTVCHFLNSSIEIVIKSNSLCNLVEKLDKVYCIPMRVNQITHASAVDNFANIFKFLAVTNAFHCHRNHLVLDKHFLHIMVFKSTLGLIKACFQLYDSLQQKTCYQLEDTSALVLSKHLKQTVVKSWNIYEPEGRLKSLLHNAVTRADSSIALFLIKNTGFANVLKDCPSDFQDLIHLTVENTKMDSNDEIDGKIAIIKQLIELNHEFLLFKVDGLSASLCSQVHVRLLQEMLLAGADPLCKDENENTLWHLIAASLSCSDFCRLLTGINCCSIRTKIVNAKNSDGDTVLQVIVRSRNPEGKTLELLKKCGADFNTRNISGFTPIFTVVSAFQDSKTIPLLLQYGADIMLVNTNGLPVVHYAASVGNADALRELVNIFLENNFNFLSWRDKNGKIPLEYAQSQAPGEFVRGKKLCVEFLLKSNCDVDSIDTEYSSDEDDLLATVPDVSTTDIFEGWEFFRVISLDNERVKEVYKLIIFQSEEQKFHSIIFKCLEKHVIIYQQGNKKIKIERQTNIKDLTLLLESVIVLSNFLKFSLGFLKVLSSDASSDAVGDLMACWILDQHLNDDVIVTHLGWCISKETDINSWSLDGSPLINEIIKIASSTKPLKFLFEQGTKADKTDSDHNNALHVLFEYSKYEVYEATSFLIKNGVDVLKRNVNGDSPVMVLFKSDITFDTRTFYCNLRGQYVIHKLRLLQ